MIICRHMRAVELSWTFLSALAKTWSSPARGKPRSNSKCSARPAPPNRISHHRGGKLPFAACIGRIRTISLGGGRVEMVHSLPRRLVAKQEHLHQFGGPCGFRGAFVWLIAS